MTSLLLTLGFVLFSLVLLGIRLGCLFGFFFFCYLRKDCSAINFCLRTAFAASHRFWTCAFTSCLISALSLGGYCIIVVTQPCNPAL